MIISEENYIAHYGILRKSGRYPYGSGGPEYASNAGFLGYVKKLSDEGMSEAEIARGMGITTTQLRAAKSIAKTEEKQAQIGRAERLKAHGWSNVEIGKKMGINESQVRALLKPGEKTKLDITKATADMLKDQVDKKAYIDVGAGVERHLGISKEKLGTAVARLKEEGYEVHQIKIKQLGTKNQTTLKVLAAPGTPWGEVMRNRDQIKQISSFTDDGGLSYSGTKPPVSINAKRVKVRYAEEGGTDADGVILVRPGVKDTDLGKSRYAQVRIAVGGTHYLKGMAMYGDPKDFPPGVDLIFNTNKSSTGNKLDAMKKMSNDPDYPFGAVIKPGGQRGVMNVVNEETDWGNWSRNLSSQMLSKQSPSLARTQLGLTYDSKLREFNDIVSSTNPAVKKKLLDSFADDADSSAVHLKAAALPRQGTHVILPVNSMKENEVYAPNYRDGEPVVLVRFPHGGIFEIPELRVNNRHPEARKLIGTNAPDAIGIHAKVAERLSGADFDGDTVLVIPNRDRKVKTAPALEGLKGFDPKTAYPAYEGMKVMDARTKGIQMGLVSNLITDMTIQGAPMDHIERAVKHSMVVIDAEKHKLNYKQSAIDNGIASLMKKYQGRSTGGASTLVSRAGSSIRVNERKARPAVEGGPVDRTTGKKVYVETGAKLPNGQPRTIEVKKLAETDDANTLSSGTPIERIYADHSNKLKTLANRARLESLAVKSTPYSPSAKTAYSKEVASLDAKLNLALRNAPLERQAQVLANAQVRMKRQANPDMDKSEIKKLESKALEDARIRTGAERSRIEITDREWEAIQAGAISTSKLNDILSNANLDRVKELATPKQAKLMTAAKKNKAVALLKAGYTQAEVADALGVSVSTLKETLSGGES
ncbi:helix-turn-helix DNA-binding domain protein [Streptomyces phage RosaAsantewaa]|nr:helix-turn-helix DNA-binding domain protein [Streptomyces phage RosaAsantewaa]